MVHWAILQETDIRLLLSGIFLRWWVVYTVLSAMTISNLTLFLFR